MYIQFGQHNNNFNVQKIQWQVTAIKVQQMIDKYVKVKKATFLLSTIQKDGKIYLQNYNKHRLYNKFTNKNLK